MVASHHHSILLVDVLETLDLLWLELGVDIDVWWAVWVVLWQNDLHWDSILSTLIEHEMVGEWLSRELC